MNEATLPKRHTLVKHIASHLEKFALICLPPGSWDNEHTHAGESDSSDSDGDTAFEPLEQWTSNEQEAAAVGREIQQDLRPEQPGTEHTWPLEDMVEHREFDPAKLKTKEEERKSIEETYGEKPEEAVRASDMDRYAAHDPLLPNRGQTGGPKEDIDRAKADGVEIVQETEQKKLGAKVETKQVADMHDELGYRPSRPSALDYQATASSQGRRQIRRSRSTGHAPTPVVRVYNNVDHDQTTPEKAKRQNREWDKSEGRRGEMQEPQELDVALGKRLADTGFTQSQIAAIIAKEKKNQQPTSGTPPVPLRSDVPVYAKIHVDYISTETLRYYDIPWEYDRVSTNRLLC
jgi:hypothetical protein